MALIKCVDCGKEVSDRAKICPNCGCPIECSVSEIANKTSNSNISNKKQENAVPVVSNATNPSPINTSYNFDKIDSELKKKLLIIGSIVAIIILIIIVVSTSSNNSDNINNDSLYVDSSYNDNYYNDYYGSTNNTNTNATHTHYYTSRTTKEATCSSKGEKTYICSCGDSYTEPISTKSHSWESATCTAPKKCRVCGTTEGVARGHNYYSDGECGRCGEMDPLVNNTLSACSLSLPTLPKSISYKSSSGKLYSTVSVTDITYKFEYERDGTVSLIAYFSGTKTYDYRGAGQSDKCRIGWKLYDANGNVFNTGTFNSPSIAEGESFSNQEDDLIYNFHNAAPGTYRLEILNVN